MPKYRVRVQSFLDNKLVNEGDVVDYDGHPGDNLEPLDAAGEAAAAVPSGANDIARQKMAVAGGDPNDAERAAQISAMAAAAEKALQQSGPGNELI